MCVCARNSVCIWEIHVYVSVSKNVRAPNDVQVWVCARVQVYVEIVCLWLCMRDCVCSRRE